MSKDDRDEDCPLCLEPLPPFWDTGRRSMFTCCGNVICKGCSKESASFLKKAFAEGKFGRQEEQLQNTCPLCRAERPTTGDETYRVLANKYEKDQLPLILYCNLGMQLIDGQGGAERNVERGIGIWMAGAEMGDPNCQFQIGMRYHNGDGVPKSTAEAKRWWLAATDQGHAVAENNVASLFRDEGNDAEYLRCLRSSASKGFDMACYNLGIAYYYGKCGLQKSLEDAIRVVTPAAERCHADSMRLLGYIMCYPDPQRPPPSPTDNPKFTKGMHLLRRAAEMRDENAIINLKQLEEWASSVCCRCEKEAPPETAFLRCSRCRAAWYCSKDCQVQHWKAEGGHKEFCIKLE